MSMRLVVCEAGLNRGRCAVLKVVDGAVKEFRAHLRSHNELDMHWCLRLEVVALGWVAAFLATRRRRKVFTMVGDRIGCVD